MLKHRIIPALLLYDGGLVKTKKFKSPKYIGDPINAIRIFNEKEVDELMVLDISASKRNKEPDYALIEKFASECFMPLTYGGGIASIEQASKIFSLGVEKICLQTAAIRNPKLVNQLAERFGRQSVVVSLDVVRNWRKQPCLYQAADGRIIKEDWLMYAQRLVSAGAGEILLTAVEKDGTLNGPDLDLIKKLSDVVSIPVIALGGISKLEDMKAAVDAGASAVAAGSFFVFQGKHRAVLISYPHYKELEQLFLQ